MSASAVGILGVRRWSEIRGATLSVTSEVAGYELTKFLRNPRQASKGRSTALSGLRVTWGADRPVNVGAVSLYGGNWTSAATFAWAANDSDSWGSPAVSGAMTPHPSYMHHVQARVYGYKFFSVLITDAANPAGYIELGTCDPWETVEIQGAPRFTALSQQVSDIGTRLVLPHGDGIARSVPTTIDPTVADWPALPIAHARDLWRHLQDLASGAPLLLLPEARAGLYTSGVYGYLVTPPSLGRHKVGQRMSLRGLKVEPDRAAT